MSKVFGLVSSGRGRGRGGVRGGYRGSYRGSFRGRGRGRGGVQNGPAPARGDDGSQLEERFESVRVCDEIDEKMGFARIQEGATRDGWLVNMHPVGRCFVMFLYRPSNCLQTLIKTEDSPSGRAAVDYYFIQDDGGMFKCTLTYEPYFCIACKVKDPLLFLMSS